MDKKIEELEKNVNKALSQVGQLRKKIEDLEKKLDGEGEKKVKKSKGSSSSSSKSSKSDTSSDTRNTKKKSKKRSSEGPKNTKNKNFPSSIEAYVNESLQAVDKSDKNRVVDIPEKEVVENELVMGDELILEFNKNKDIKSVKVSQRAKRSYEEALVTSKDDNFYAVSKYNTHKLLDYDVKTKGILKGFDVVLRLPDGEEDKASVCLVKEIESTDKHNVSSEDKKSSTKEDNSSKSPPKPKEGKDYDPRVVEEDDLV